LSATTTFEDTFFPRVPRRLRVVDETTVAEHYCLSPSDRCYYVWEYTAGRRYDFSPANRLIANLKIKPTDAAANPHRGRLKEQAIRHTAGALRTLIQPFWVEKRATLVPMPPSKTRGHLDCDDRVHELLRSAFIGLDADIRSMLEQASTTRADHESAARLSSFALRAILRLDATSATAPPRANIAVVDDVLNSGKHFRVARELISARYPGTPVIGIFIARCVHPLEGPH